MGRALKRRTLSLKFEPELYVLGPFQKIELEPLDKLQIFTTYSNQTDPIFWALLKKSSQRACWNEPQNVEPRLSVGSYPSLKYYSSLDIS